MSEDKVRQFPGRGRLADPGFQAALRGWRQFAHRRGMVVASPIQLLGAERTFMGDSDDEGFGPKDYRLTKEGPVGLQQVSLEGLYLSKNDKEFLEAVFDDLDERADFSIKEHRAPSDERVEEHEDERGRWDLWLTDKHRVGTVVRVGEGSKKHYLLYLWFGGWVRVTGQPTYDLPLFGLPELRARPEAPVMIHEGPKSRLGACAAADQRTSAPGRLLNWMSLYVHVGWHGSDIGMEWTDWSVLRGRRVLIWPDIDEAGIANARILARRIARMGGIVEYVNWGRGDIEAHEGWDWGDPLKGSLQNLTRTEVRQRIQRVESPVGPDGRLLTEWCRRSFFDMERKELYVESREYRPVPLENIAVGLPKNFKTSIMDSPINPFVGVDYRPGLPPGRMWNGKINLCPPHPREPVNGSPLPRAVYEEVCGRWLRKMIPDPQQRKHLIRRAAWSVARPQKIPQHMVILQGDSNVGKSVLLNLIAAVAGEDRSASLLPESIMGRFNAGVANKSVVCIHEIHSNDISRRQNAARLKELIANEVIIIEEKNRPRVAHANVIHWFAATNERVPFTLEHGNDRFYFVKCVAPQNPRERKRLEKFFSDWVPRFKDQVFLDEVYAAAKHLVDRFSADSVQSMIGRARRQKMWKALENDGMTLWEKFLKARLEEVLESEEDTSGSPLLEGAPVVFYAMEIVRLTHKEFKLRVSERDIQDKMVEWGYRTIRDAKGHPVKRRLGKDRREPMWCRAEDLNALMERGDYGSLQVRSVFKGE